jgi:prepilin-type N-terminal cleavage/methylation domain-containing protein
MARPVDRDDRGFTLAELLVATVLSAVVLATAISLVLAQETMAETPAVAIDGQQRARLALSVLRSDLERAGEGPDAGPMSGPLSLRVPAVMPRRVGASRADSTSTVRTDAVSVVFMASPASATALAAPIVGTTPVATTTNLRTCPMGQPACGIAPGAIVLILDEGGRFALYLVGSASGVDLGLQALQSPAPAFPAGAAVVPVEVRTYYFEADSRQLRVYDGHLSDTPVADDVVGLSVEYLGDPFPSTRPRPPLGTANCLVDEEGHAMTGRSVLSAAGGSLAYLQADVLRDGPWCGEGPWTYDVDLLRIRAIHFTVRVQAGLDRFRLLGAGYQVGGTGRRSATAVPDLTLSGYVAPRNLNSGR